MVETVEHGVELIEAFDSLAKRQTIIQCVQRCADKIYSMFIKEMEKAKVEHEQMINKNISKELSISMPIGSAVKSGVAIWTQSLIKRVERLHDYTQKLTFIKETKLKREAEKIF